MTDHSSYVLRVTAGSTYASQKEIQVNTESATKIKTELIDADIKIRIKNFRGIPSSPSTSPYFTHPSRAAALYSLEFSFILAQDTSSDALLLGNDFDHPIRDRLPPLFGQAFKYAKSFIDPGLDGDPQADKPYLYGKCLGSINAFSIGETARATAAANKDAGREGAGDVHVIEEGADAEDGKTVRREHRIPATGAARQKFFLSEQHRKEFVLRKGTRYNCDFFNGYLDFNEFALKLPLGLSINVVKFWDGQPLRYVLRNKETNELYFCVSFTLVPVDDEARKHMEEQTGKKLGTVDDPATEEGTGAKPAVAKADKYEDEGVD